MKHREAKLLHVLVFGGALLLGGGACGDDEAPERPSGGDTPPDTSGETAVAGDADVTQGGDATVAAEPVDCGFCPNEQCCGTGEDGSSVLKEGFACCWNTTC